MRPPAYNGGDVQQISQEQGERNVAMAVCVQLAGRAIIRVVSRCEEAQDNCNLGLSQVEHVDIARYIECVNLSESTGKICCTFWRHLRALKVNLGIVNRYEALAN